jgi:hypothetical protein
VGEGLFGRFGLAFQGLSCPLGRRGILIAISSGVRRGGWVGKDLFTVSVVGTNKNKNYIYIYIYAYMMHLLLAKCDSCFFA